MMMMIIIIIISIRDHDQWRSLAYTTINVVDVLFRSVRFVWFTNFLLMSVQYPGRRIHGVRRDQII